MPPFPAIVPRFLLPRPIRVEWYSVSNAVEYRLYATTNDLPALVWAGPETNCVLTNITRRVTWTFFVRAVDEWGVESDNSNSVLWPVPSIPLTNHVLAVFTVWRETDALDGLWRTNRQEIFSVTNSPEPSRFWQAVGMEITSTNF